MAGFSSISSVILAAEEGGGGLHFPSMENLVIWPAWFGEGTALEFNKITFIAFIAFIVPTILFFLAGRKASLVPRGIQNVMEASIDFLEMQVIRPAIGPDGMKYLPLIASLFFFIWIGNLFEVIPTSHMPSNARMAGPLIFAIVAVVMFIAAGVKAQGPKYFANALFPPGVPKALYILITPIEFLSTFLIRPFSLAVRLFANLLAGHILLVTFGVLCITLWQASPLVAVNALTFPLLVAFTGFEFFVAFLQAFIFSLLTAVYIGGAVNPDH